MRPLLILALMALAGCATPEGYVPVKGANNCLVDAISYQDSLAANQRFQGVRWSKILCVNWGERIGHAGCVFEYRGRIMVYDNAKGSQTIQRWTDDKEDPLALGKSWIPATLQAWFEE